MVQGVTKQSATGVPITNQDKKKERAEAHTQRKGAPTKRKAVGFYDKHNHAITSSIGRNIEAVMASRLVHEGGRLSIVPAPENVEKFDTSRARISSRQVADLKKSTKARMGRAQRDGSKAMQEGMKAAAGGGKKSKNNKLGPKKGAWSGVDSDDEELKQIRRAEEDGYDPDEIIPRTDVIVPNSSDEEEDEMEEEEEKKKDESESESDDEENEKQQPAAKRRRLAAGTSASASASASKSGASGSNSDDDSSSDDDDESATIGRSKGGAVKTMLGSWLDQRRKKKKEASGKPNSSDK